MQGKYARDFGDTAKLTPSSRATPSATWSSPHSDFPLHAPPRLVREDPPCLSVSHPSLILVCLGVQVDDDELSSVLDGADLSTSLLQPRKQVDRRHLISSQVHMMSLPIPHPGP